MIPGQTGAHGDPEPQTDTAPACIDIQTPGHPLLPAFYALYSRVFTLAEERESPEGFDAVLRLNADAQAQARFGPFREGIAVVRDAGGDVVAGINYALYGRPPAQARHATYGASCQINFICVDAGLRAQGIGGRLLAHVEQRLRAFAPAGTGTFTTCEQNAPARMTPRQLAEDLASSGLAPDQRLGWWRRKGFRRLEFDYVQPPLGPEQAACDYIDLYLRTGDPTPGGFPAEALLDHLYRFFWISVGKLEVDIDRHPVWLRQKTQLQQLGRVGLSE